MKTKREKIITKALEIIKLKPQGIRYSDLIQKLQEEFPDFPRNTIEGTVWNLDVRRPKEIYKPTRGVFHYISFKKNEHTVVKTNREKIAEEAIKIIKSNPSGIKYSELVKEIHKTFPAIPINTVHGTIYEWQKRQPKEIYKPARGLYRHSSFKEAEDEEGRGRVKELNEEDFYKPFADYLINELEECTKAIPLGGNKFKDKWGTPDVIGIREPRRSDIIKPPTEIISAEIKSDSKDLITAFGQACAYRLFSHKSYMVVPKNSSQEDIAKLDALCLIFGLGLILFDTMSPDDPQFEIRVRSSKHDPDMLYVNRYLSIIEKELF